VLGSDGIWELLTKKEVVDIVSKYVEEKDSSMAARELVETASQRWFVVIFFGLKFRKMIYTQKRGTLMISLV
jgi:hypothetical protein